MPLRYIRQRKSAEDIAGKYHSFLPTCPLLRSNMTSIESTLAKNTRNPRLPIHFLDQWVARNFTFDAEGKATRKPHVNVDRKVRTSFIQYYCLSRSYHHRFGHYQGGVGWQTHSPFNLAYCHPQSLSTHSTPYYLTDIKTTVHPT